MSCPDSPPHHAPLNWIDISASVPDIQQCLDQIGASLLNPLPIVFLYPKADFRALAKATQHLLAAQAVLARDLCKKHSRAEFATMFDIPAPAARFIDWDALVNPDERIVRFDFLRGTTGPKIVEFNVFCGVGGPDLQSTFASVLPRFDAHPFNQSPFVALADHYAVQVERYNITRLVLLDWEEHKSRGYPNFDILQEFLHARMPDIEIVTHTEKTYPRDWLQPDQGCGTLVHRVFTLGDLKGDLTFLEQLQESNARLTNGFEAEICMNKHWLGLLCDPDNHVLFNPEQIAAIKDFLPDTYALSPHNLDSALADKDRLVFKWNSSYGGEGIYIGHEWATDELAERLASDGITGFSVQEIVPILDEYAPVETFGEPLPMSAVFGLYSYAGKISGLLTRASVKTAIVNAASGSKVSWGYVRN
ncbi:MAG: hypothetical protein V3V13_02570 [Paracoccaceae bacterium]